MATTNISLVIWTIRSQLENGYTVSQWCQRCQERPAVVDLQSLTNAGHGEKNIRRLRLRCACHSLLEFIVQPPSRHSSRG